MENKLMVLGDEMLGAVSGGHKGHGKRKGYKRVEQTASADEIVDFSGATVTLKGNASLEINFGDDTVTQSA